MTPNVERWRTLVTNATAGTGIPVNFVLALMQGESGGDPTEVSTTGARGLLQITGGPLTDFNRARGTGWTRAELFEPEKNVAIGVNLLRNIVKKYSSVAGLAVDWSNPDRVTMVIQGWNAGYGDVFRLGRLLERQGRAVTPENVVTTAQSFAISTAPYIKNTRRLTWARKVSGWFIRAPEVEPAPLPLPNPVPSWPQPDSYEWFWGLLVGVGLGVGAWWLVKKYQPGLLPRPAFAGGLDEEPELPPKVAEVFRDLGDRQRGAPESAMLQVKRVFGGGVLRPLVEDVGDLIHRMTHMATWGPAFDGYTYIREKVEPALRALRRPYGFAREMREQIISNAKDHKIPPGRLYAKITKALKHYANEHAKLPVYNKAQWLARTAAVAVGNQDWRQAERALTALDRMSATQEIWRRHVYRYKLAPDGGPVRLAGHAGSGSGLAGLDGMLVTPQQVKAAKDNKAAAIVAMPAQDFLALTTYAHHRAEGLVNFKRRALPLDEYNRYSREGETIIMPNLLIDRTTGRVRGHEGRHRAIALIAAEGPEATLPVALRVTESEWPPVARSIPKVLRGQFDPDVRIARPTTGVPLFDPRLEQAGVTEEDIARRYSR